MWKWFASAMNRGSIAILSNTGLIKQVYLPKFVFPGAALLTSTVKFLFIFVLLLIFLCFYGLSPNTAWLALPAILTTQFLFNMACCTLASIVVPFFPDIKILIDNGMMVLFFMSGIFFSATTIPENLRGCFMLNPMFALIESYRSILLQGRWPSWNTLLLILLSSIVCILLALLLMRKLDRLFPKVLP